MDEIHSSHSRLTRAAGVLAGALAGIVAVVLAGTALAHRVMQPADRPLLEATHLPPLLTTRDERHRAALRRLLRAFGGGRRDAVRRGRHGFRSSRRHGRVPGDRRTRGARCIRELRGAAAGVASLGLPPVSRTTRCFGATTPTWSERFRQEVRLHPSGACRWAGASGSLSAPTISATSVKQPSASSDAGWGTGAAEVGLEQGKNLMPIGGSAFDIDHDGSVVVLDEANKRLLRWRRNGRTPDAVPLAINGTLADMSIDEDGTIHVLETTSATGRGRFSVASIGTAPKGPRPRRPGGPRRFAWDRMVRSCCRAPRRNGCRQHEEDRRLASPSRSTQPSPAGRCPTAGES